MCKSTEGERLWIFSKNCRGGGLVAQRLEMRLEGLGKETEKNNISEFLIKKKARKRVEVVGGPYAVNSQS